MNDVRDLGAHGSTGGTWPGVNRRRPEPQVEPERAPATGGARGPAVGTHPADVAATHAGDGTLEAPAPPSREPASADEAGAHSVRLGAREIAAAIGRPAPTPEQVAVIEAPTTSLLVVAGAGSGKTDTMASRVVWLVANGLLQPSEVLGLTFTRKAAGELAARINGRLAALAEAGLWSAAAAESAVGAPPTISTYHAYAGRLVAEHGLRLGVEPDSRLLSQAAAWQFAHEVVTRYDGPMEGVEAAGSTVTAAVVSLAGELAEHLRDASEVADLAQRMIERIDALPQGPSRARGLPREVKALRRHLLDQLAVLPIVEDYQRLKRDRDCLDFADQMALAARVAEQSAPVRDGERARFRAVLLDEFQDTSEAQLRLLHALFAAESSGGRAAVPVMAVGDPHQSIYGWRGASATTLDAFVRRFAPAPRTAAAADTGEVPVLPLSTSWRNDSGVLAVANATASPLAAASAVPVERLVPAPGAGPGTVSASRWATAHDEARAVAERIAEHWWADASHEVRSGHSAAVLCRRRAQFPVIVEALRTVGLPVEVVGLGGLLTTPEVSDVVALLGVVDDPARGDLLMRLLTGPRTRLGAADLAALGVWSRQRHAVHIRAVAARAGEPSGHGADVDCGDESGHPRAVDDDGAARSLPVHVIERPGDAPQGIGAGAAPDAPVGEAADAPDADRSTARGAQAGPELHDVASLVEAIHDLPPAGWRGPDGEHLGDAARERLVELADTVADLRAMNGLSLPELVVHAERALGLDVEVAARPDVPESVARVHLEAFVDAVADFSTHADRPTLGGFLSWLDAARDQERGLDMPVVGANDDAVQVLTVHAAKGLEWDVVAVPGLVEGAFPSHRSGVSSVRDGVWRVGSPKDRGWTGGLDAVPYELRGDVAGLPGVPWRSVPDCASLDAELVAFQSACGAHLLLEERRLAYVAFTRPRHALYLSASVWSDAATPRITSRFFTELLELPGLVAVGEWAPMPPTDEPARNPLTADPPRLVWPLDREGARDDVVRAAARRVEAWRARTGPGGDPETGEGDATVASPAPADEPAVSAHARVEMEAIDADIAALLEERRRGSDRGDDKVELPGHLSASAVVAFARDPAAFVARLRRPMPEPPAVQARRGTAFHAWVEEFYGRSALFDVEDDPLAQWAESDDSIDDALMADVPWDTQAQPHDDLERLRALFVAGPWAQRTPVEVEVDVETVVAGVPVRGRLDAVFARGDGGFVIVDWKTGRVPDAARLESMTVQLAVYALAYRRLHGLGADAVDAAFYFAASGETVYPRLPTDDALEATLTELFAATMPSSAS